MLPAVRDGEKGEGECRSESTFQHSVGFSGCFLSCGAAFKRIGMFSAGGRRLRLSCSVRHGGAGIQAARAVAVAR